METFRSLLFTSKSERCIVTTSQKVFTADRKKLGVVDHSPTASSTHTRTHTRTHTHTQGTCYSCVTLCYSWKTQCSTLEFLQQFFGSITKDFQSVLVQREKGTGHGHGHRGLFTIVAPDQHLQQLNQHVVNPQALDTDRLPTQRRQEIVLDDDLHLASFGKDHVVNSVAAGVWR